VAASRYSSGGRTGTVVAAGPMVTPAGVTVGHAYAHAGDPPWVVVTVPGWARPDVDYYVRLDFADGHQVVNPAVTVDVAQGTLAVAAPAGPSSLTGVALVSDTGRLYCAAVLST
jgi:hypothetical protein